MNNIKKMFLCFTVAFLMIILFNVMLIDLLFGYMLFDGIIMKGIFIGLYLLIMLVPMCFFARGISLIEDQLLK